MTYNIIYISIIIYLLALLFLLLFFIVMGEGVQTIKQSYRTQPERLQEKPGKRNYLELLNMTTGEVLLFKDKKDFINSMAGYETIKHFLKGTEEENIKKLIDWYYPGFERV